MHKVKANILIPKGVQYEAYIYAIDRQAGFLLLRIDQLQLESGSFNVSFLVQEDLLGPHARALFDMNRLLSSGFVRKALFPEESDGVQQTTLNEGLFSYRWFDHELNYEQQVNSLVVLYGAFLVE